MDRNPDLSEMQLYGAEDSEELDAIYDAIDRSLAAEDEPEA